MSLYYARQMWLLLNSHLYFEKKSKQQQQQKPIVDINMLLWTTAKKQGGEADVNFVEPQFFSARRAHISKKDIISLMYFKGIGHTWKDCVK